MLYGRGLSRYRGCKAKCQRVQWDSQRVHPSGYGPGFNTRPGLWDGQRCSVTSKRGAFTSAKRLEPAIAELVYPIDVALIRPARP